MRFKTNDFDYYLPKKLIAQYPLEQRSASRLLSVDRQKSKMAHQKFHEIIHFLNRHDLLVFNNTRVIPARLCGVKSSGGEVECLVERVFSTYEVLAHIRARKAPKIGSRMIFENRLEAEVVDWRNNFFILRFLTQQPVMESLSQYGRMPLPPYIKRAAEQLDEERYQTVYAKIEGAVAAPTAGLHFDETLLKTIVDKGVNMAFVTLHVGAGTFQPIRVQELNKHRMHSEYMELSQRVCDAVIHCRRNKGRVIAVGTTSVRCLETAGRGGELKPYSGETNLFIHPGFQFQCVDALITNFHLPQSTLLMLVAAFGGYELIMKVYREAVARDYRFFSYGDAMFLY